MFTKCAIEFVYQITLTKTQYGVCKMNREIEYKGMLCEVIDEYITPEDGTYLKLGQLPIITGLSAWFHLHRIFG